MTPADSELTAYLWLLALPRIEEWPPEACAAKIRELVDRQVKIFLCPGALHATAGAPLVRLCVLFPGKLERVSASGNDLYTACDRLQAAAWAVGVKLPSVAVFHMRRQVDPKLMKPEEV